MKMHAGIHTHTHTHTRATFSQEERVYKNDTTCDQSRKGIVVESYMVVSTHYLGSSENVFCEKNINAVHKRKIKLKIKYGRSNL